VGGRGRRRIIILVIIKFGNEQQTKKEKKYTRILLKGERNAQANIERKADVI